MHLLRSWLFTPGHRRDRIDKALGLPADAVVIDLQDAVPPAERGIARQNVANAVNCVGPGPLRFVRLEATTPGHGLDADLAASVRPGTYGLCLPNVNRAGQIAALEKPLRSHETAAGLAPGQLRLAVTVETALGVINAPAIAAASPRILALMIGVDDLAADLGLWSVQLQDSFLYARSAVAIAAASRGLQAIDRVCPDFRDIDGLRNDAQTARGLGFSGKILIHPTQIETVNTVFSPTAGEIEAARRIVAASDAAGGGAIALDGRMIDRPIVERARRALALADAAARRSRGQPGV